MTSIADEVYSLKSTIFNLQHKNNQLNLSTLYQNLHLHPFSIHSTPHLHSTPLDAYTSSNTQHLLNHKQTDIIQRLLH